MQINFPAKLAIRSKNSQIKQTFYINRLGNSISVMHLDGEGRAVFSEEYPSFSHFLESYFNWTGEPQPVGQFGVNMFSVLWSCGDLGVFRYMEL